MRTGTPASPRQGLLLAPGARGNRREGGPTLDAERTSEKRRKWWGGTPRATPAWAQRRHQEFTPGAVAVPTLLFPEGWQVRAVGSWYQTRTVRGSAPGPPRPAHQRFPGFRTRQALAKESNYSQPAGRTLFVVNNTECQVLQSRPTGIPPKSARRYPGAGGPRGPAQKESWPWHPPLSPGTHGPPGGRGRNAKVRETHQVLEWTESQTPGRDLWVRLPLLCALRVGVGTPMPGRTLLAGTHPPWQPCLAVQRGWDASEGMPPPPVPERSDDDDTESLLFLNPSSNMPAWPSC